MAQKPLISVVMPVFNPNRKYLSESIKSIMSQTYDEIELIVVLDKVGSSKDKITLATLEQFHDDHRLQLMINREKIGFANSLNKGLTASKGKYIGRMDHDDVSLPARIHEQLNFLQRKKLDLVGCWSHVIDGDDQVLGYLSPPSNWSAVRKHLLFHNPFVHSSILFSRRIITTAGLYRPDFYPSEDYEFYLRVFSNGFKGGNVPKYLHLFREHESSMIHGNKWKINRIAYLRCKITAVFQYGFNKPRDIFFAGITPFSIFIKPSYGLSIKRLFGLYKMGT